MCIFCKIIKKQISSDLVYENDTLIAFKDIKPSAPVHILIVPKKHIESVIAIEAEDKNVLGDLVWRGKILAQERGLDKTGYKLIFNCGRGGGQIIDHIHLHLMGGWDKK
ncbi:histidine triad nucleotide-binding protein [Patescibacteria group bacterium AH-259-L05]|nr:histidine triad nucleotide-binding protein [Patescibacteria group bacterium AH-259-L05]